jgi:predicted RNA binding protein YcfA (HicA-like mRNA interferase family)
MSKRDKLIQKIMNGKNVSSDEAEQILVYFGYTLNNQKGSHKNYEKAGCDHITIVSNKREMKPYQVKYIQEVIKNERK